jgi:hypothetical protein
MPAGDFPEDAMTNRISFKVKLFIGIDKTPGYAGET